MKQAYKVQYIYIYDGKEYVNDKVSILSTVNLEDDYVKNKYIEGAMVDVIVNPTSPSEAILETRKFSTIYFESHMFFLIVFAIVYLWNAREYKYHNEIFL